MKSSMFSLNNCNELNNMQNESNESNIFCCDIMYAGVKKTKKTSYMNFNVIRDFVGHKVMWCLWNICVPFYASQREFWGKK